MVSRTFRNGDGEGILGRFFRGRERPTGGDREATVVAITSGKGGTGKSFLATNLGVALSQTGRKVVIVDCDFGLGNAHLLLGVNPKLTLQHVLGEQVPMEEVVLPTSYGPMLVPAGSGISRLADLSEEQMYLLAQGLGDLASGRDVLILDTAAGISPQCLFTLLLCRHVVIVTNPEIAALTDAYALIKCVARQPARPVVSVIVNRVPGRGLGRVTFDKLADVSRRFAMCEVHYLGEIPDDPSVTQRRLGQPPLLASEPDCEASNCIREITENLRKFTRGLRSHPQSLREGLMARFRAYTGSPAGP